MTTEYAPFDIASHLDSDEMIAGYLSAAAEDDDPNVLLGAIAHVAKARGMRQVAEAAGLGRESLYKTLAPGAHPRFETIQAVLRALNVRLGLHVSTERPAKARRRDAMTYTDILTLKDEPGAEKRETASKKALAAALKRPAKKAAAKSATPAKKHA